MTAWCLRTPLALKTMSSLIPPSSDGVQVTVRLNEPSGCDTKHKSTSGPDATGGQIKKHSGHTDVCFRLILLLNMPTASTGSVGREQDIPGW